VSNYLNGSGQSTIVSGVLGGDFRVTPRLRASLGGRWEYDNYVQSSENASDFDLDNNPNTPYDNVTWGNGSFRHFTRSLDDWAASLGLNFALTPELALYASGSRGYKMPALDEFLGPQSQGQVDVFQSRTVQSTEAGVKYAQGSVGATVNGFFTQLKNQTSQGSVVDSVTGRTTWIITPNADNRSYGAEFEVFFSPMTALQLRGSATWLRAELGKGAGADIGQRLTGIPASIGNLSATYEVDRVRLLGDWHYVAKRVQNLATNTGLPAYNYFNFGAAYTLPGTNAATIDFNVLNAFQSHGLEEGNPRIISGAGAANVYLARPLLPRRLTSSIRYNF
jgi:outer membrane receptor protein involved in Fe transport